jgi:hypothetical protein
MLYPLFSCDNKQPQNIVGRRRGILVKTQGVDTALLDDFIKKSGLKVGFIVDTLGISRQAFNQKRKGKYSFRAPEVYVLCDILKIPDDVKPKIFCL